MNFPPIWKILVSKIIVLRTGSSHESVHVIVIFQYLIKRRTIFLRHHLDKCIELMVEDAQEYNNVDVHELGLFVAVTATKTELQARNLHKYCPKRSANGRPPTITSCGTSKSEGKCCLGWIESEEKPTAEEEIRRMMSFAIGVNLRLVLKNHIFKFNNKI